MKKKLTVLFPVRNEGITIKIAAQVLLAVVDSPLEILIVYDSLDDQSVPYVKELESLYPQVRGILNNNGSGVARAIEAGVQQATSEIILISVVDELAPICAIGCMLALMEDGCGFVSATRYAYGGKRYGGSLIGHILSATANSILSICSSVAFTDLTTGFKMFRRKDFDFLVQNKDSVGWSVMAEMAINAQLKGLKLGEVPIVSVDRLFGGESTFKVFPWIKGYLRYFFMAVFKLPIYRQRPAVKICKT